MVRGSSFAPSEDLQESPIELSAGDVIETESLHYGGRYQLLSLVGAGAFGSVYRARDVELEEDVAIKVLRPEQLAQQNALSRFRKEVRLARRVSHPNVARTYDIGRHDGELFLTMEFIEGQPLTALCPVGAGPASWLPRSVASEIGSRLCAGLGALHEAGIVHQDMKTDNVLVSRSGRVAITDFGIASVLSEPESNLSAGSPISGTPAYMAPEQARGYGRLDTRADLYALGVMLFQMFTGRLPFAGESAMAVALARLYEEPIDPRRLRPDLGDGLAAIILRCLRREPDDRFQTAAELATALESEKPAGPSLRDCLHAQKLRKEGGGMAAASQTVLLPDTISGTGATVDVDAGRAAGTDLPALAAPASVTASSELTVAVLPFEFTPGEADAYQAYGLTEAVIDALSDSPGLRVMGFGIIRGLPLPPRDPRLLGQQLLVKAVVDGTLRRRENGLEAIVRLYDVDSRLQFAIRRVERRDGNILALATTLATHIAQLLSSRREGQTQADKTPLLGDPQAMDLYLRARHHYHLLSVTGVTQSIELFEQALRLHPEDPTILTGYAKALIRRGFFSDAAAIDRAVQMAQRAACIAPHCHDPTLTLALAQIQHGQLPEAATTLRRTLARAPQLVGAQEAVGALLSETGPLDLAARYLNAARMAQGFTPQLAYVTARTLVLQGKSEAALAELDFEQLEPAYVSMALMATGRTLTWLGDRTRAQQLLAHPVLHKPEHRDVRIRLQCICGQLRLSAHQMLPDFYRSTQLSRRAQLFCQQLLTEFHCVLGEHDDALTQLVLGAELGMIDLMWAERCPLLAPLRVLPGFPAARARIKRNASAVQRAFGLPEGSEDYADTPTLIEV